MVEDSCLIGIPVVESDLIDPVVDSNLIGIRVVDSDLIGIPVVESDLIGIPVVESDLIGATVVEGAAQVLPKMATKIKQTFILKGLGFKCQK